MWFFYAILSAITAALVAIFGKIGLGRIDPTLATTVRSVIMALFLIFVSFFIKKSPLSFAATTREWLFIILSGLVGALSWLFYFVALSRGLASRVVAIDRLSIVFVVLLATVFLGEALGWKTILGAFLMVLGAVLLTMR